MKNISVYREIRRRKIYKYDTKGNAENCQTQVGRVSAMGNTKREVADN